MSTYIKINNEWTVISKIFKKENNSWVEQNDLITALGNLVYLYGGHTAITIIVGESQYVGKSFLLTARKGGEVVYPTWSIISGNEYATINSNGKVTINVGALNNSITVQASYDGDIVNKIIAVSYDNQLTIEGPDLMTGTSGNVITRYNSNIVSPSWSITTGSEYATIDSSGNITILSDGNIVVSAAYSSYSATKNITLIYDAGTTSQTEVDPDTGSITTTTTTTTTDPETGATTETSSSTVTNEDGSTSNTSSETITNTDGSSSTTSSTTNSDGSSSETTSTTSAPDESGSTTTESNTTTTNADGTSSETNATIVENEDGSSSSQSETVHYDENGDTTGSTTNDTEVNADGSSTSSTTNFNAEGDPTDQQNVATDTTGNIDTQDVEFNENGDPTVIGYEIDTTASDGSGKDLTGNGVNTEFVPFAFEEGFTMHIRFKSIASEQPVPPVVEDTEDTGTNYLYNIMSAKSTTKINNVWPGFDIRWAISKTSSASTFQFRRTLVGESSSTSTDIKSRHLNNVFDFIVTYNPAESSRKFSLHDNLANDYALSVNKQLQNDLNLELTIGYALNMQGNPYRYSNVTIYDFTVSRLDSTISVIAPTISCDGTRVNITCSTPGALIYYRTATENLYDLYTSEFLINADTTVQAYAVLQHKISSVTTQECEYDDGRPDEPVISCDGQYVTITCATQGATIYYRLGESGNYSIYSAPIELNADTIVEAYSEYEGLTSDIVSESCDYDDGTPDDPIITCDGEYVTITCTTPSAIIYYSFDGETYELYHTSIPIYTDVTAYAYAELNGLTSNIVSEECDYTGPEPEHDYSTDYLTFDALTSGTISWKSLGSGSAKTIEYSKNNGAWTSLAATSGGATISVSQGDSVRFRGSNTTYCASNKNNYSGFEGGTATYNISGNIMSLVYGDNFAEQTTLPTTWVFCSIFKKSKVISAENLILPATTLTYACYRAMFSNATSLEVPPALPATTLADYCYWYMFENCAITAAPELRAETLTSYSYGYMFTGCTSLNYIKCLAKTKSATSCLQNWVKNVAASGTFIKDSDTSWSTGISGIPTGWVVYNDEILQSPVISCDGEHITITCETPDSSIYYKLDDAVNYSEYTSIITITEDTTVYAYSSKGGNQSPIIEQECIYIEYMYKFAGLEIAPGPLCYDSSDGYTIKDSWNYDSYNSSYGKVAGSSYFDFIEMGELFDHVGFDTSSGSINNVLDPFDSWRLPTKDEWGLIVGTSREGSTVNGNTAHYALIKLTNVTHADTSTPGGILLFPDGETITGVALTNIDNADVNTGITEAQLTTYLEQGCAFLPTSGAYFVDGVWLQYSGAEYGYYLSSTEYNQNNSYNLSFSAGTPHWTINTADSCNKSNMYCPVRLIKESSYGQETPFEASNKLLTNWEL